MAESIITLGIGATPVSLTPFITTGLLVGTISVDETVIGATIITNTGVTTAVTSSGVTTAVTTSGAITVKDGGNYG